MNRTAALMGDSSPVANRSPEGRPVAKPRIHWTAGLIACVVMAAAATTKTAVHSASATGGTIRLRAAVLEISAAQVVATGSPVITSEQGTVSAGRMTVNLDPGGRAVSAVASGGVQFTLTAASGPYRSLSGSCSTVTLYPSSHRARLDGKVQALMTGPGAAPARLVGSGASIDAPPGRPARVVVMNAQGVIASRA